MLDVERHRQIVELVRERDVISTAELADLLCVSQATIRRDLATLSSRSLVQRVRGGGTARTRMAPSFVRRGASFFSKRAIAKAAVESIVDGESVMVNGGTTTFAMVEFLQPRELSILSNSLAFASALVATRNRIVIPGGPVYSQESLILGFDADACIECFRGSTLFTSCYGLNRLGLMEKDPLAMLAGSQLLKCAERIVVLADSSKLQNRSSAVVVGLSRISMLITDENAAEAELQVFRNAGVQVLKVATELDEHERDAHSQSRNLD